MRYRAVLALCLLALAKSALAACSVGARKLGPELELACCLTSWHGVDCAGKRSGAIRAAS